MKTISFISACLISTAAFAQADGAKNDLFNVNDPGQPKAVSKLGAAPEYPFLSNLKTPKQVYRALVRQQNAGTEDSRRLNEMLIAIGYSNGISDLEDGDITEAYVPIGTRGNMGSAGHTYNYTQLTGNRAEFKAWKIASGSSKYQPVYVFAKCGNTFFPKNEGKTACVNVPIEISEQPAELSPVKSGGTATAYRDVYVYYLPKRHRKNAIAYPIAGINAKFPSKPVKVTTVKSQRVLPETYVITVSPSEHSVYACPDSAIDLATNINIEKAATYFGNYPDKDNRVYKQVTKKEYKFIARKMRKSEKKAVKIARRTHTQVRVGVSQV